MFVWTSTGVMGRHLDRLLLMILSFWIVCQASSNDKKPSGLLLSPIENFQESLIAATSHGTAVALQTVFEADDGSKNEAVLLILHSEGTGGESLDDGATLYSGNAAVESNKLGELDVKEVLGERLAILDQSTIACMTGLASDVDFLFRVLQKGAESQRSVHNGDTPTFSRSMSAFQHVQALCKLMQDSCFRKGTRPFGVQAMFVGKSSTNQNLDVFTVDPGGSFRHWKTGSAIGKKGFAICKRLSDYRVGDPLDALKQGIEACIEEFGLAGHFCAFFVRPNSTTRSVELHQIHSGQIKGLLRIPQSSRFNL